MGKAFDEWVEAHEAWYQMLQSHITPHEPHKEGIVPKTKSLPKTKTENKTARFGMRVAPETKEVWNVTAKAWGYKSTSEWLEAMANWAIDYEKYEGSFENYMKVVNGG